MIQPIEEKVEEDFLFFLEHFKGAFDTLKSESEKEICKKWLDKLAIETYKTSKEKQTRNIYLSQLILSMNDRKLSAPFNAFPNPGALSLDGVFKHITAKPEVELKKEKESKENQEKWAQFIKDRELEVFDLNHLSNDGRTYVACKTLPENSGIFSYVAVTMGGNTDGGWVDTYGKPIPAPLVKQLDLKVVTPKEEKSKCEQGDKVYQITAEVRSVLSNRKPNEARMLTYQFFKNVYNSIEQEMLNERDPNSTACNDPYVQKLLEKLLIDSQTCENFDPRSFKRINMLSMLKKRVKNTLNDIEERDKKLSEIQVHSTSPLLTLVSPASTCSNSMSEMMWQGALLEKPTSKMAEELAKTYPACLVKMLLAMLARERRKIINRMQEKQEKLIVAMKKDLKNEIQRGIVAYKVARKEWVSVMRIVTHYNKLKGSLTDKSIGGLSRNSKGGYLQETVRKEIENTKKRLEVENKKIETLQDDICELNKNLHELTEKIETEQVQSTDQLRDLKTEICNEKSSILGRAQTIEELEKMLKEIQK